MIQQTITERARLERSCAVRIRKGRQVCLDTHSLDTGIDRLHSTQAQFRKGSPFQSPELVNHRVASRRIGLCDSTAHPSLAWPEAGANPPKHRDLRRVYEVIKANQRREEPQSARTVLPVVCPGSRSAMQPANNRALSAARAGRCGRVDRPCAPLSVFSRQRDRRTIQWTNRTFSAARYGVAVDHETSARAVLRSPA